MSEDLQEIEGLVGRILEAWDELGRLRASFREARRAAAPIAFLALILFTMAPVGPSGCMRPGPVPRIGSPGPEIETEFAGEISGVVDFGPGDREHATGFRTQADLTEVANAATVSLIDVQTGNTVSSSVTDAGGAFVLTFQGFDPVSGAPYTLEAVKGLSVGGKPNRPGAPAVRIRTLLFWDGGWKSLTNATPGVGIVVSQATTALATLASLKQSAGQPPTFASLIGKITGSTFDDSGTGLSRDTDFAPVLSLVGQALALDQDPVGAIAYDRDRSAYRLATGVPLVTGLEPAIPTPGGQVTLRGLGFDPNPGRSIFWFGDYPAATWSVSADRSSVTVVVPAAAYSAPFTLQQPGGVLVTVHPFLKLRGTVGTLAGSGVAAMRDGSGTVAGFNGPSGLDFDSSGNLYVADVYSHAIRKVTPEGRVATVAGGSAGDALGQGAAARFSYPYGVRVAARGGFLYVADSYNQKFKKVGMDGTVTWLSGSGNTGYVEGAAALARFTNPLRFLEDPQGNLIVSDHDNRRIRKVSPDGDVAFLAGAGGAKGFQDGSAASARFCDPADLAVGSRGEIYVADACNHAIRVIEAGSVSTLAGLGGSSGYQDGKGNAARFSSPWGMVRTANGDLLVADAGNHRIRKVTATGAVTTLAGDGVAGYRDGQAASAEFNIPWAIALDSAGILYVTELGNHRIRVIVQ